MWTTRLLILYRKGAGVSFLSRFSIPVLGGKKKDIEDNDDNESEFGENRTSGMNANAFSTSIRANGYIPQVSYCRVLLVFVPWLTSQSTKSHLDT